MVKGFAPQAEHKQVNLRINLRHSGTVMRGDSIKLSWVISNLLANALRHTAEHGLISLTLEEANNAFSLKVRDTGPGIPPQIRDRLFERFTKWSINGAGEGSAGLGLAIVQEIVGVHGGRIFVDTTEGMGTCFTVDLPVRQEGSWLSC